MATYTYKNAELDITDTDSVMYTCPDATVAIIQSLQVANIDGTNACWISASWTDDSNSDKVTYLCKELNIPIKTAIDILANVLVLEAGDTLKLDAGANNDLQATAAILEIT